MRTVIAIVLVVVGLVVALGGIGFAISELVGLYSSTISDPLGDSGAAQKDLPRRMFIGVAIGASGIIPLMIGSAILKIGLLRKLRKSRDPDAIRAAHRRE